jgi:hypothetical protein
MKERQGSGFCVARNGPILAPFRARRIKHNTRGKPLAMFSSPFGARISIGSSKIEVTPLLKTTPLWFYKPRGLKPDMDANELHLYRP